MYAADQGSVQGALEASLWQVARSQSTSTFHLLAAAHSCFWFLALEQTKWPTSLLRSVPKNPTFPKSEIMMEFKEGIAGP